MRKVISGIGLVAIVAVAGVGISAQEPEGRVRGKYSQPGTHIPAGEAIMAVEATAARRGSINMSHTIFESKISGADVSLRTRRGRDTEAGAHSMHTNDEVMYFTDGFGTLVTGGTLPPAEDKEATITDGKKHNVRAGDFVIIPAGTAHFFETIPVSLSYIQMSLGEGK